jgi:lysophospholipase L1-like esterase
LKLDGENVSLVAQLAPLTSLREHSAARGKFARTLLLTAVLLMSLEAAVRIRAWVRNGQAGTQLDIYTVDQNVGVMPRSGAIAHFGSARTSINSLGMRGREISFVKAPGTLRVLCLGESTTFGQPADDDKWIWPARLEEQLSAKFTGRPVEVLNAAVPGFTAAQSLERFRASLAGLQADIVIISHGVTDLAAGEAPSAKAAQVSHAGCWQEWRDSYSLAYNLLRSNTTGFLAGQFTAQRRDDIGGAGATRFETTMIDLVSTCRRAGAEVLVCTVPRSFALDQSPYQRSQLAQTALFFNPRLSVTGLTRAYDRYNQAIRNAAAESGAMLLDLDKLIPRGPDCFIDSVHFSPAGHERVAQEFAAVLGKAAPHALQ